MSTPKITFKDIRQGFFGVGTGVLDLYFFELIVVFLYYHECETVKIILRFMHNIFAHAVV
jgi:hypothetical protein